MAPLAPRRPRDFLPRARAGGPDTSRGTAEKGAQSGTQLPGRAALGKSVPPPRPARRSEARRAHPVLPSASGPLPAAFRWSNSGLAADRPNPAPALRRRPCVEHPISGAGEGIRSTPLPERVHSEGWAVGPPCGEWFLPSRGAAEAERRRRPPPRPLVRVRGSADSASRAPLRPARAAAMAALLSSAGRLRAFCPRLLPLLLRPPAAAAARPPAPASSNIVYQIKFLTVAPQQEGSVKEEPVSEIQTRQTRQFDWALNRLDNSVRKTGRIPKTLLLKIYGEMCKTGCPGSNQILLLLRSCGALLPEVLSPERTELAHMIWDKMKELGAVYDTSHYNALLKVYLQNEHKFSPTDFLARMEEANVQPNRVTYQRLIAAYCNEGDIEGASKILGFMKNKDLPITEAVFSSLVKGHARSGDMKSAENILSVMRMAGVEPGPDTYLSLLNMYAEKGDADSIKKTLQEVEKTEGYLMDRILMQVIFSLAKAGYPQYIEDIKKHIRFERELIPDAMNLCLTLITHGFEDTSFHILKSFNHLSRDNVDQGSFFLQHCVNRDMPVNKLKQFCSELKEANMHSAPLQFILRCALETNKSALAIEVMKMMKEECLPLRPHYSWPLLVGFQKEKNLKGIFEVLKVMHELGVELNAETYTDYVFQNFADIETARAQMKKNGCLFETVGLSVAEIRYEAAHGRLNNVFSLLSSASTPPIDIRQFRSNLILGFKSSDDVHLWSKITELLYKDERYCLTPPGPTEAVGYFLYHLIDSMSDSEVQAKEERLRQYFHQLKKMNIVIPTAHCSGICRLLDSSQVPELIKDARLLSHKKILSTDNIPESAKSDVSALEKKLEKCKAENQPITDVLKQLIHALCEEENMQKALEVKAKYEPDMVVGGYAALINLCCRHDNVEEAMNLKEKVFPKNSPVALDTGKYLALVEVLGKHGRLEDAINILTEMKEKDVPISDRTVASFSRILNAAAMRGEVETVNRLHETIVNLGLAEAAVLHSPLIAVHLEKDDMPAALEALINCYKKYGKVLQLHNVYCRLIEKGDTDLLQKVSDFISREYGDMMALYDLFFAFLQTGKYKEARRVIETPGLRAHSARLQWFAKKCISNNKMEALEHFVELTQNLFECDRDEMYYYLLQLCEKNSDWKKAEGVWTKIQEENVVPREKTLLLLADILEKNGQVVPFEVPKVRHEDTRSLSVSNVEERKIRMLCRKNNAKAAYSIFLNMQGKNEFHHHSYSILINALLTQDCLEEAMEVKHIAETHIKGFTLNSAASSLLIISQVRRDYLKDAMAVLKGMLDSGLLPARRAVIALTQALAEKGDLKNLQVLKNMWEDIPKSVNVSTTLLANAIALAHTKNNDLAAAVEYLEPLLIAGAQNPDQAVKSISYLLRKVSEEGLEQALETFGVMAERLASQFGIYRPVTDLFLQYVSADRVDDARSLIQRYGALIEKRTFVSFMARSASKPGQAKKIETLLELIPEQLNAEIAYHYLMRCYELDEDVASVKAVYEKTKEKNIQLNELSLKSLATFLKKVGEPVPFTEPPETFKFYVEKTRKARLEAS
ncbi:leucine-rich PPR motif-containing protein, mitochondrial [Falco rusticolus]|uniref:leucine-rich PPR motif-containing protein, mitochondrial n=1 Tax=Falco rusticolus TaxID=120794 RepID=UPI0018868D57|nr:leucine-rich PPR motif-containing protein, mitochondrial [Falco rusticolus]XP_055581655.1 leucine-rich PPR motif-containing protein, mitochondrial isoform X1 [Falco cherrug]